MNEAELCALQRAISIKTGGVSDCPDMDTLIAFADGALDAAPRELTALHVAQCDPCVAIVRVAISARQWSQDLAVDIEAVPGIAVPDNVHYLRTAATLTGVEAPRPDRESSRTSDVMRRKKPRMWWPAAIAATLASVFVANLALRQPPMEDGLRGVDPIATSPMSGTNLSVAPEEFSWPCAAAPGAASVELLGADALPRWKGSVRDCAVSLPIEVRQDLAAGEYLWRVKNAAGEPVLGPMVFRISP